MDNNNQFNNQNIMNGMESNQSSNSAMFNQNNNQPLLNSQPNYGQQSMNNMMPGYQAPKKTNNLLTVIIIIVVIALILGVILLTNNKEDSSQDEKTTQTEENNNKVTNNQDSQDDEDEIYNYDQEKNLADNIKTSGVLAEDGKFVVFVTNKNNVIVDIDIKVEFFDANGKSLGYDVIYIFGVISNAEIAEYIYSPPANFTNYKIIVEANATYVTTYYDKVTLTHKDNGEEIVVIAKNNSQDVIEDIDVTVVYYKGDKVVGIKMDYAMDIKPGAEEELNFYYPYDNNYNDLEFDSYKVYLVSAYNID